MANKADIAKLEKKLAKEKNKVLHLQRTVYALNSRLAQDEETVKQSQNLVEAICQIGGFCTRFDLESAIESAIKDLDRNWTYPP